MRWSIDGDAHPVAAGSPGEAVTHRQSAESGADDDDVMGASGALTGRPRVFDGRQQRGDRAQQRQEGAQAINEFDAVAVGNGSEHRRTDAAHAEGEAEEQSGHRADPAGQEFLRINDDGGKGRRQDEADADAQNRGPVQADVGQRHGQRRDAEDREPDDALAAHAVPDGSADQRADRGGEQEQEQIQLRRLHG